MIVAIKDGVIVAAADLVSEIAEAVLDARPRIGEGQVFYRVASTALQAAIDEGHALDSIAVLVGPDSACLAPDPDIRTIRDHVLSVALENAK